MLPPSKEVVFNALLEHDDGLLVNTVMQKERLSGNQASAFIAEKVSRLKARLGETPGMMYAFGELGHISMNPDEQISFAGSKTGSFYPECFGLSTLNMLPLKAYLPDNNLSDTDTEKTARMVSVNWRFIRHVAAVAVLVLIMMTISTPIPYSDGNEAVDYASVVSAELLNNPPSDDTELWPDFALDNTAETPGESVAEESDNPLSYSIESPVDDTCEWREYVIIVATFSSRTAAEKQRLHLENDGVEEPIGIWEKNGKYRLCVASFDQKKEAQEYLNRLKSGTRFSDAWIMQNR